MVDENWTRHAHGVRTRDLVPLDGAGADLGLDLHDQLLGKGMAGECRVRYARDTASSTSVPRAGDTAAQQRRPSASLTA